MYAEIGVACIIAIAVDFVIVVRPWKLQTLHMWAILHLQLQHQLLTQWTRIIILTAYRFIVFNFYILLWGRVIKYTMIIYMNLSRLEWNTCVSYCSKKWQITQEMIYVATARWNAYWNIYVIYHTLSSDWFVVAYQHVKFLVNF